MVLRAALPATGALASVVGSCSRNDSPRSAVAQSPPLAPQPPASSRWEEEEGMASYGMMHSDTRLAGCSGTHLGL